MATSTSLKGRHYQGHYVHWEDAVPHDADALEEGHLAAQQKCVHGDHQDEHH